MKLTTITFLLFLFINTNAQQGWNDITPAGSYPGLLGVYAIGSDNIWVVGEEGTILKSTDGGITWISVANNLTENLNTVEFVNPDTGWIAGPDNGNYSDSAAFRTTDGGLNWEVQSLGSGGGHLVYDIDFVEGPSGEPMRGFITGGLTTTWRSDDYGGTWDVVRGACGYGNFWSCSFVDKNTGWFVGEASNVDPTTILCTTDGGVTWIQQVNPTVPEQPLHSVCFATNQRGLAVGLVGTILYTSDGGANWETRPNSGYRWQSVFLTENGKAWAVGNSGNIAYSNDWGYTWTAQQSGVTCELWEVFFINDNEGWIAGGGIGQPGVLLHTTTGGVITNVEENNVVREFELLQNYPNPFNPETIIKYKIQSLNYVTLKVYDGLGNEVATVINKEQGPGSYEIEFNAEGLSSGVYYYNLKAGDYSATKKMLLVK